MIYKHLTFSILFQNIETFYSLVALNKSALENSQGPMIVQVYRSGDVSQSSNVNLRTFTTCKLCQMWYWIFD